MLKKSSIILAFALVFLGLANSSQATPLDLALDYGFSSGGPGTGRGIGIYANQDFTMDSFGIYGDILAGSYDVVIYSSSNGSTANAVMATYSDSLSNKGTDWYEIGTNYNFAGGQYYILNWRPTDGSSSWSNNLQYYYEVYTSIPQLPRNFGILNAINGIEGYNADSPGNTLLCHFRLDYNQSAAIPEPATLSLLSLGLLGFGVVRRRRGI